eukprot:CAMPEP_0197442726 /NCGR_PEP_ID=MMETSP1175-20131217/8681_1 /TAXON_ID=1003142 /ORGANISM="Triceratium dubium, Strain CCMP147" /LENGTH=70 /DNA_ID=CAMNT_0042973255 /DNA_START=225 /DNA_END=437 /DNA_ORIENTATION=+
MGEVGTCTASAAEADPVAARISDKDFDGGVVAVVAVARGGRRLGAKAARDDAGREALQAAPPPLWKASVE